MSPVRTLLLASLALVCATEPARAATPKEIEAATKNGAAYLKKSGTENGKEAHDPTTSARPRSSGWPSSSPARPPTTQSSRRSPSASATRPTPRRRPTRSPCASCTWTVRRPRRPRDHSDARRAPPGRAELRRRLDLRVHPRRSPGDRAPAPHQALRRDPHRRERPGGAQTGSAARRRPGCAGKFVPAASESSTPRWRSTRRGCSRPNTRARARSTTTTRTRSSACSARGCRASTASRSKARLDLIEKRFLFQQGNTGGWPYHGPGPGADGSRR